VEDQAQQVTDRLLDYGVSIIKLTGQLQRSSAGGHIGSQLLRSGTSAGANYEEARGAQSRADFIHKMQIVLKELRESQYWLKLIQRANLLQNEPLTEMIDEAQQLCNIIGKSLVTAKSKSL
jgi:four helix bundle protein